MGVDPVWPVTAQRVGAWWGAQNALREVDFSKTAPVVVVTGFVAATAEGTPTTLKRSGSDYSATIFARLMKASRITMWKDVNGVYTADPRRVPEAFPITSLKYDEAMELAYFGAQVLHPSAMLPCIEDNIPVYVRNIFNPAFGDGHPGAQLSLATSNQLWQEKRICAARCAMPLESDTAPIGTRVSTTWLRDARGTGPPTCPTSRTALRHAAGANVGVEVTQASADSSICTVPGTDAERCEAYLNEASSRSCARATSSVTVEKEPRSSPSWAWHGLPAGRRGHLHQGHEQRRLHIRSIAQAVRAADLARRREGGLQACAARGARRAALSNCSSRSRSSARADGRPELRELEQSGSRTRPSRPAPCRATRRARPCSTTCASTSR